MNITIKHFHYNVHGMERTLDAMVDALSNLSKQGTRIMTAISDFAARQGAHNDRMDAAVAGLQGDVQALKGEIAKLQSTQGQISAEDQALLDGIEARAGAIADKLDALDALTPPAPPAEPAP